MASEVNDTWTLGVDVAIEDKERSVEEISVNDIVLSGSIVVEEISIDITSDTTNNVGLDVYFCVNGVNPEVVDAQIVPYDEIIQITDLSTEAISETYFAASALSAKKIYDQLTNVRHRVEVVEAKVDEDDDVTIIVDTEMSDLSENPVGNKYIKQYVDTQVASMGGMFYWADDEHTTIGTKYNFFSEQENSAGGQGDSIGEGGSGSGGGINPDELEDILSEKGYATEGYVDKKVESLSEHIKGSPSTFVPLKTINGLSLYGSGNISVEGGGGSSEGLTAINVNDQSFQPDSNGIVTLPDYMTKSESSTALGKKVDKVNGKGLSTNDYTTAEKNKLADLKNYDDTAVTNDISALKQYFTDGKANDADKLDGKDSSYFATAQSVSGLSEEISATTSEVTSLKSMVTQNGTAISTISGNVTALAKRIATAENSIVGNADGVRANAEDIVELDKRLDEIEEWRNLGGGDIDVNELESILDKKGYATQASLDDHANDKNNPHAVTKKQVGLGNVENTALSTWTGSSNISSVGTITAGTWKGSKIANLYLANNSITIAGTEVALGASISAATLKTGLGLKALAYKDSVAFGDLGNVPTTLSGYGITDAYTKKNVDSLLNDKVDKEEGKGLSTNDYTTAEKKKLASLENYDDSEIKGVLSDIEAWYNEVGTKFSKEKDGSIKMDGDFFTTGENSAGGAGSSVGGSGGGIDEGELNDILNNKGYATESWVNNQGFAKGEIPTRLSQLTNDKGFITADIADQRYAMAGTVSSLEEWYNTVGNKFSVEPDGSIKMDGDFFTTGENSAGGSGESVGGSGGGLDESELEEYLGEKGYVTDNWVDDQGFAKEEDLGALAYKNSVAFSEVASKPTSLSGYGITDAVIYDDSIDTTSNAAFRHFGYGYPAGGWVGGGPAIAFGANSSYYAMLQLSGALQYQLVSGGEKKGWKKILTDSGNADIDSDRFSCRGDLVIHRNDADGPTYINYGPYSNDGTDLSLYGATIYFITSTASIGGNTIVKGTLLTEDLATFKEGITINAGKAITFIDDAGAAHTISYDSEAKAFKVDGNLYATGESSAGMGGVDIVDIEGLESRVTALESNKASNVNIKISSLKIYNQQSITTTAMTSIAGLTVEIANNMLNGLYNKVIDNSGTYPKIWNYTATRTASIISVCMSYGDGINTKESCRLDYTISTGKWTIDMEEL